MYAYVRNNPTTLTDPDGLGTAKTGEADCWQEPNGTLHCTVIARAPQDDFPKATMAAGALVLTQPELGPADWIVGAALLGWGCYQTSCGQSLINLFSETNNAPPPPAAASSSSSTTASANPSPGGPNRKWKFGHNKDAAKWARQMKQRGWTEAQIDEAIEHGTQYPAQNNVNPGNAAIRYVNPQTGLSVVVDNVTNEVIHVGGAGFLY
jgi:hypothetical protein